MAALPVPGRQRYAPDVANEDPGPVPARGVVVRAEGEGFLARLWPRPRIGVRTVLLPMAVAVSIGIAGALLSGTAMGLRVQVFFSLVLFVGLLSGVAFGVRFVPIEIAVDDTTVYWSGERWPIAAVGGCRHAGDLLELLDRSGNVLARAEHLDVDAARWVASAVRASLPAD